MRKRSLVLSVRLIVFLFVLLRFAVVALFVAFGGLRGRIGGGHAEPLETIDHCDGFDGRAQFAARIEAKELIFDGRVNVDRRGLIAADPRMRKGALGIKAARRIHRQKLANQVLG